MAWGFGVDVGGTTVKIACFDTEGTLHSRWEIPTRTEQGGKQILPDIAGAIQNYMTEQKIPQGEILGIGIGVPGAVENRWVVNRCVNLGWDRLDVREALGRLTGLPVVVGNDATLAALGEWWKGGGQKSDMVLVTLGTGVGGGIVLDGKSLAGTHGAGGEIGHIVVNPDETEPCSCGKRGCAEQYCSATGIVRLAKRHLAGTACPSELKNCKNFTCKDVFDAAARGDIPAIETLEQVYGYLGRLVANVCCVVDPEIVVLGGGVSKAGQPLLEGARQYFETECFHACRETRFALATLGNDAGVYGAFCLLQRECI